MELILLAHTEDCRPWIPLILLVAALIARRGIDQKEVARLERYVTLN